MSAEEEGIAYLSATVCLAVLSVGVLVCYFLRANRVSAAYVPDCWVFLSIGACVAVTLQFWTSPRLARVVFAVDSSFSEVYFALLLPPVIFLAGLQLDLAGFFSRFYSICVFAFLGTMTSAFCIALPIFLLCLIPGMPRFGFVDSFLLGSILSATDSVAVISAFDSLHVRPDVYSLVFGESVFNDAVAIVLFRTFASFESEPATLLAALRGVGTFVASFLLSTVIGTGTGVVSALLFKHVRMSKADAGLEVERAILVVAPFISYMFAEGVHTSGVVAVLFTGIMTGRFTAKNVNADSRQFLTNFYRVLSLVCESLAFCYIGIALPMLGTSAMGSDGWSLAVVVLMACLIARGVSTWACASLVNAFRQPNDRISQEVGIAVWLSGLRGGVAFALSLAAKSIVSQRVGQLLPPVVLFIVLSTSVAISIVLPQALEHLDLVSRLDALSAAAVGGSGGGLAPPGSSTSPPPPPQPATAPALRLRTSAGQRNGGAVSPREGEDGLCALRGPHSADPTPQPAAAAAGRQDAAGSAATAGGDPSERAGLLSPQGGDDGDIAASRSQVIVAGLPLASTGDAPLRLDDATLASGSLASVRAAAGVAASHLSSAVQMASRSLQAAVEDALTRRSDPADPETAAAAAKA